MKCVCCWCGTKDEGTIEDIATISCLKIVITKNEDAASPKICENCIDILHDFLKTLRKERRRRAKAEEGIYTNVYKGCPTETPP